MVNVAEHRRRQSTLEKQLVRMRNEIDRLRTLLDDARGDGGVMGMAYENLERVRWRDKQAGSIALLDDGTVWRWTGKGWAAYSSPDGTHICGMCRCIATTVDDPTNNYNGRGWPYCSANGCV